MRKLKNNELKRLNIKEFKKAKKLPIVIILDGVRSLNNIGSVFRTSDAFRIEKIYLCGITAKPPHRDIHKTALGATDSVEWEHIEDASKLIKELQEMQYFVYAVEQADESISLENFKLPASMKCAFIFGNEVKGVNDDYVKIADGVLEIPQFGTKHSLNISVSVGVVLWASYERYWQVGFSL